MQPIQVFKDDHEVFGSLRSVRVEGEPWFFATDVAKALGYKRPYDAVNRHCKNPKKLNNYRGRQNAVPVIIDEKGTEYTPAEMAIFLKPEKYK